MSTYFYVAVPLKSTIEPTRNPDAAAAATMAAVPRPLLAAISADRKAIVKLLSEAKAEIAKKHQASILHGEAGIALRNAAVAAAEKYATSLLALEKASSGTRAGWYFYWGESIAERHNVAFRDSRYDLLNIHFNLGALEMERAALVVWEANDEISLDAAEKVAYGALCNAAGHFQYAAECGAQVDVTTGHDADKNALPPDASPEFCNLLHLVAVAEAQEIGAAKAAHKEENKGKDLVPKLCSRVAELYDEAILLGTKKVACNSDDFKATLHIIMVKKQLYVALSHAYHGAVVYDKEEYQQGLWHVQEAETALASARQVAATYKLGTSMRTCLDAAHSVVSNLSHKVLTTNRLVARAKAGEGPYPLPPGQVLARPKQSAVPNADAVAAASLEQKPVVAEGDFAVIEHDDAK